MLSFRDSAHILTINRILTLSRSPSHLDGGFAQNPPGGTINELLLLSADCNKPRKAPGGMKSWTDSGAGPVGGLLDG
jgi:hypothetical protein